MTMIMIIMSSSSQTVDDACTASAIRPSLQYGIKRGHSWSDWLAILVTTTVRQ